MAKFLVTGTQTVVIEVEVEAAAEEEALKLVTEHYEGVEEYEVNNKRIIPQDDLEWEWVDSDEILVVDVQPGDVIPDDEIVVTCNIPSLNKK